MKQTILNAWHKSQKAQMTDFGGWEMPVSYGSLSEEHLAVRHAAGLFDISHMGQLSVRGPQALDFLQWVTSNDVAALGPGRMQYSLLPAEDGGLLDDIIVGRLKEEAAGFLVVVNAANSEGDLAWLRHEAKRFEVQLEHLMDSAMFALQGPESESILQSLTGEKLDTLRYYHLTRCEIGGLPAILSRSGYTGEDGFEICLRNEDAPSLWEKLLEKGEAKGMRPIGLGARNTLRLEMAYALYGHEIDRSTAPHEAGLGWVVKLSKGDFVGKAGIEARRQSGRRLCGFEMLERGVARDAYPILDAKGTRIGQASSASPSPTSGKNIGLGFLPLTESKVGTEIFVEVRGKALKAAVVATPFVPSHVRKNS